MKILIVGGGKVGSAVAEQLVNEGHDITVIDTNNDVLNKLASNLDIMTLCGSGSSPDTLSEANIEKTDLLIACSEQDEVNALCCMFGTQLGCKHAIARVRTPEYASQIYKFKDQFGLSMTVNPELYAALEVFNMLELPGALKRDSFAKKRVEIIEIVAKKNSVLDGIQLKDLSAKLNIQALVCAIQHGNDVVIPDGNYMLQAEDKVYFCAPTTQIVKIIKKLGLEYVPSENVLIVGAGRMTEYLCPMLTNAGANVTVIESDKAKAQKFATAYTNIKVLNADGTVEEVLNAEHIEKMDAVAMLTGRDEDNLILSLFANKKGVPKVIAKVGHTNFGNMFEHSDKINLISPKKLCADAITRYVRAMQNSKEDSILTLHHIVDDRVAAIEFEVSKHFKYLGKPLMECNAKQGILIACINRSGKIIIPAGRDYLSLGDTVVIVSGRHEAIVELNDCFK